jgi:hypothetical protein
MPRGVGEIFQGLFILLLALAIWRTTGSFIGWLVLFLPAAYFIFRGLFRVLDNSHDP